MGDVGVVLLETGGIQGDREVGAGSWYGNRLE